MKSTKYRLFGILPALYMRLDHEFNFYPIRLVPFERALVEHPETARRWGPLVDRYAIERGAIPGGMLAAYVMSSAEGEEEGRIRDIAPLMWSLMVHSFVGYARTPVTWRTHGVPVPEQFFIPSFTPNPRGSFTVETGANLGTYNIDGIPLRWPVDSALELEPWCCDKRVLLAAMIIGDDPERFRGSPILNSIAAAADTANAAMERHEQKAMFRGHITRRYMLLSAAFECLERKGSTDFNGWKLVAGNAAQRLSTKSKHLLQRCLKRPNEEHTPAVLGTEVGVIEHMLLNVHHARNELAHGKDLQANRWTVQAELGDGSLFDICQLLLTILIGQDLLDLVGLPRDASTTGATGKPRFKELLDAEGTSELFDKDLGRCLRKPEFTD